jgi:Holliday junction resolvase RusA-like endonuclease
VTFCLLIPGKPTGKGRARHGAGRTFTPRETTLAEETIRAIWRDEGSPRIEGPVELTVELCVTRPRSHYTAKGSLSTEGKRHAKPSRQKPDVDNALKLVMDALNTLAWRDDVEIVSATVRRLWAAAPHTNVLAREAQ